jgi:hypothetical protein
MDSGKKESMTTQMHQIYIRATPEAIGARPRRWRMLLDHQRSEVAA